MADTTTASPRLARDPAFGRLWSATTASGLATWALPFILGLAVASRELTATGLGLILAVRTVGFLVAVPIGGVLADRYPRRVVVLVAGLAAAVATPVIAVGLGDGLALAALAAAVVGAGQGACRPALQALTAEVVAPDRRQAANAAITLAVRVTTLVSPGATVLAATLVDVTGLLLITAALWLITAVTPPAPRRDIAAPTAARAGLVTEFVDGVREARRHPWFLAGLGALTTLAATGYAATGVILPLVSRDRFGGEAVLAAATTAYVVGALIGAVLIARWRPRNQGWTALAALACYGFAPLALLLPVPAAVLIAVYILAGLGVELFNVPWFTATQREVAPDKLARVSSLDFLLSYGLAPLGLAAIAPAVEHFGAAPVLGCCAAACLLAPALAALVPSSRHFARRD